MKTISKFTIDDILVDDSGIYIKSKDLSEEDVEKLKYHVFITNTDYLFRIVGNTKEGKSNNCFKVHKAADLYPVSIKKLASIETGEMLYPHTVDFNV